MVSRLLEKIVDSVMGDNYVNRHLLVDIGIFIYIVVTIVTVYFILEIRN